MPLRCTPLGAQYWPKGHTVILILAFIHKNESRKLYFESENLRLWGAKAQELTLKKLIGSFVLVTCKEQVVEN